MNTDVHTHFKTTPEEKAELYQAAKHRRMTISAYLRMLHRREWKRIKREKEAEVD